MGKMLTLSLSLAAVLTASCSSTMNGGIEATQKEPLVISSVSFVNSSPPLSAELRRESILTVNSDLSTRMITKDGYNKVLSEKSGTITPAQFDTLSTQLNTTDYIQLKPKKRETAPIVGGGSQTLIIKSDKGAHRFTEGATTQFPDMIKAIYETKAEYIPTQ